MNKAEREKASNQNPEHSFEEGYYFDVVHTFCDFLTEAYYENSEGGRKWQHLIEVLKEKLPIEVFDDVFGDAFSSHLSPKQLEIYTTPALQKALTKACLAWFRDNYKTKEENGGSPQGGPDCAHRS